MTTDSGTRPARRKRAVPAKGGRTVLKGHHSPGPDDDGTTAAPAGGATGGGRKTPRGKGAGR